MPFYLFSIRLVAKDKWGQETGNKLQQFIRQINNQNIDNVWRIFKKKAETHYGSKMSGFAVVMLSKLDPRTLGFIEDQAKKKEDKWDDIFKDIKNVEISISRRQRKGIQGGKPLGERD